MTTQTDILTPEMLSAAARECLDVPWVHQGRPVEVTPGVWKPAGGLDCLGLLIYVCRRRGLPSVGDRSDYPLDPDGVELRQKLGANMRELRGGAPPRDGDVKLIQFPGDEVAKHLGIWARGPFEPHLVHAFNGKVTRKVIEEPLRRWLPYVRASFRFPSLCEPGVTL